MIGRVIGGHKLITRLGSGGMGVVYRAEDTLLGRATAVKMLHPDMCANQEVVQRFFNEARAASAIRHLGIVEIYTFGFDSDGTAYIVMEHLQGESLGERLERQGTIAIEEAMTITRQVTTALSAAHAHRIVHRDLKPDNIFLIADADMPGGERIKLLDFGIAKLAAAGAGVFQTRAGQVMGTPAYMAPEQCAGAGDVDHRADLYALGCTLYRMLCGRVPFDGTLGEVMAAQMRDTPLAPRLLAPGMSPALEAVILRLMAKRPAERFGSAAELREALDAAEARAAVAGQSEAGRVRRSLRAALLAGAGLAVAAAVVGVVSAVSGDGERRPVAQKPRRTERARAAMAPAEKPPAAEQPATAEQPAAEEQSAADEKSAAYEKAAADKKPADKKPERDRLAEAERLNDEGQRYFKGEDFEAAYRKFREAAALSPDGRFFFNMCHSLNFLGRHDEAIRACERVEPAGADAELVAKARQALRSLRDKAAAGDGHAEQPSSGW
jgi:tetratricopeptide (TPR) repeat protein